MSRNKVGKSVADITYFYILLKIVNFMTTYKYLNRISFFFNVTAPECFKSNETEVSNPSNNQGKHAILKT